MQICSLMLVCLLCTCDLAGCAGLDPRCRSSGAWTCVHLAIPINLGVAEVDAVVRETSPEVNKRVGGPEISRKVSPGVAFVLAMNGREGRSWLKHSEGSLKVALGFGLRFVLKVNELGSGRSGCARELKTFT